MQKMDEKLRNSAEIGSNGASYRVGILAIPGFALMSYACTVEPLRAANLLSRRTLYDVVHFGQGGQVGSSGAAKIEQQYDVGARVDLDLLLVVAGGDPFAYKDPDIFAWLSQLARRSVRIGGVSGGSVILANAGVMSGRRATVHWEHAPALTEQHPDILIERRLYVMDRDRVTCGGGTAPLDLMHALIASQHGRVFARLVSDWFLHTDIRGAGDPQRASVVERFGAHSPHVVDAVLAMESHIGDPLSLPQLSMIAQISHRQLNRLFVQAFGFSVMEFYRRLRLDTAKQLVRGSAMSFTEIAEATGFSNAGHFSNAYTAQFGLRQGQTASPRLLKRSNSKKERRAMKLLVLQHADVEHPGIFRQFLEEDGHTYDTVELDAGETLPALDGYDALWVLGGPMDVWQEDAYPWLADEKAYIREAVEGRGLPFLGLCLGHQLLAEALGGTVGPSETPEIGVMDVQLTEHGASGVVFDGLPERFPCLQWHSAEVKQMPAGAQCLATSPACAVQAMKWGTRAFSAQFHIEVEGDTVANWAEIAEYKSALENAMGEGATTTLNAAVEERLTEFNTMAERLYINWMQMTAQA